MPERILPLMLALCACAAGASAPKPEAAAPVPTPVTAPAPAPTIAHRVLAIEDAALPGAPDVSATLDAVLDAATARVRALPRHGSERDQAVAALTAIGEELDARRFVYPGRGLVDTLHDTLDGRLVDAAGRRRLAQQDENAANPRRLEVLRQAASDPTAVFHVADCDMFSILYVAVGERLGLPIAMIDLPDSDEKLEHVYVIWTLSDGTQLAWEPMTGAARTLSDDDHYVADGLFAKANLVARRAFGVPMTEDEVLGYWHRVVGATLRNLGHGARAAASLREAIRLQPGSPIAASLLAWMLATSSDPAVRDAAEAIAVAERLVADWPLAAHVDTLAAAHAAAGRWDDARTTQCRAIALSRGLPDVETCDGVTVDPDAPGLDGWEQTLAMYLRCQAHVDPRHTEWLAEGWRDALEYLIWDELAIVADPIPWVAPPDACGAGDEPPR